MLSRRHVGAPNDMMVVDMSLKKSIVFLFIIAAIGAVFFAAGREDPAPATSQNVTQGQGTSSTTEQQPKSAGVYVDYSEINLTNAQGQKVLFFHAPWCSQCRAIEQDITQEGVPSGYTILKVDFDSSQALRQKYGITFRTAFLKLDQSNNKLGEEYIAYNEPTFAAVKRDFLLQH